MQFILVIIKMVHKLTFILAKLNFTFSAFDDSCVSSIITLFSLSKILRLGCDCADRFEYYQVRNPNGADTTYSQNSANDLSN